MQSIAHRIGLFCITIGAIVNFGFFVAYAGEISIFFVVVAGWTLAPWLVLAATLRLRPLSSVATVIVASIAALLLVVSAVFV